MTSRNVLLLMSLVHYITLRFIKIEMRWRSGSSVEQVTDDLNEVPKMLLHGVLKIKCQ